MFRFAFAAWGFDRPILDLPAVEGWKAAVLSWVDGLPMCRQSPIQLIMA